MGLKLQKVSNLPIGVDLGSSRIKMAQLRNTGSGMELLAAVAVDLPGRLLGDPAGRLDFQAQAIRSALRSGGFKGRRAVLSLPAADTFLQPVKVPADMTKDLDEAVRNQLHGRLSCPVEEAVIRHVLAATVYGNEGQMEERIVVAVPRAQLDGYLDMAARAGLEVLGINVEACAVVECFSRLFRRVSDQHRLILFLDIGLVSTQVVVIQGPSMVFAHNLAVGGLTLDGKVAEALGISVEQAQAIRQKMQTAPGGTAAEDDLFRLLDVSIMGIAGEIAQCLRYCESIFKGQPIECVVFVGGQGHNKRLCQCIAERLDLPAKVGDPMTGIRLAEQARGRACVDAREPQPSWAVAVGLGLGAAQN